MSAVMDSGLFKGYNVRPSSIALSLQVENGLSDGKSRARWLVTDGPSLALQLSTSIHCLCGHQLRGEQASNTPLLYISRKNTHPLHGEWFQSSALCPILLDWVMVSI